MKKQRIYIDTSVVGGCLDDEFREESCALFEMARRGEVVLLTSTILFTELEDAPPPVQDTLRSLPRSAIEDVAEGSESERLRDLYVEAGVVGESSLDDAHHVALAVVSRADVIVSWNFKHIVNLSRIRGYNAVNIREGYSPVEIRTPKEVIGT